MKAELIGQKTTKKYKYVSLLIANQKLFDYELVKIWNGGVAISIMLRKKI